MIAAALGVTLDEVHNGFAKISKQLVLGGFVAAGDMGNAVVIYSNRKPEPIKRNIVLAGLSFGWISPLGSQSGQVRKFAGSETLMQCTAKPKSFESAQVKSREKYRPAQIKSPIETLFRRKDQNFITPEHLTAANDFREIYAFRESVTAEDYKRISSILPVRVLQILIEICGDLKGFETVEKEMGLPARSAKVMISFALDVYRHAKSA
ncbi:MAG: DUF6456 domain-containing protein [Roseobacter sp.]